MVLLPIGKEESQMSISMKFTHEESATVREEALLKHTASLKLPRQSSNPA